MRQNETIESTRPPVKQSWLRAFLFLITYVLLLISSASLIDDIVVLAKKIKALETLPHFYFSVILNIIISFVLVYLFRKRMDKRSFKSLGFDRKGFSKESILGFVTGILLCCIIAIILWAMQLLQWFSDDAAPHSILTAFGIMILVAFAEELVFRGYLLNNLMQGNNKEVALVVSALIFAAAHSLNPQFNLTAFLNIFLAGLLLGMNYIFTKNLWFGILFHVSWNFVQGVVLGFKVSGIELPVLLQQNIRGSVLLTGGEFGLEASWLTAIVFAITIPVFYFLFQKKYQMQLPA